MGRIVSRFVIPIIGFGVLTMIPGCYVGVEPWAPDGHWGNHHYYYYPDSNVYYDWDRGLYFYHDGGSWRESRSLPPGYHVDRDRDHHGELHLDTDRPYSYHDDVNKKFAPGQRRKMDRD